MRFIYFLFQADFIGIAGKWRKKYGRFTIFLKLPMKKTKCYLGWAGKRLGIAATVFGVHALIPLAASQRDKL